MTAPAQACPLCGESNLDPRRILVGLLRTPPASRPDNRKDLHYEEIITLKCQQCGWLGEERMSQQGGAASY